MKKTISLFLAVLLLLSSLPFAFAEDAKPALKYEHDPMEDPTAAADIVVNPKAVYGFSPNPESKRLGLYAEYDWTNPELVEEMRQERILYHNQFDAIFDMVVKGLEEDLPLENIAWAASTKRNLIRLDTYVQNYNKDGYETAIQSNKDKYGSELGLSFSDALAQFGSYEMIILKALSTNPGMDACCGLYDLYYDQLQRIREIELMFKQ